MLHRHNNHQTKAWEKPSCCKTIQNGQQPAKDSWKDSANKIWSNLVTILEYNDMKIIVGHNVDYTIAYPRTGLSPDTLKKQNQVIYSE
jgi:hypothetical protein